MTAKARTRGSRLGATACRLLSNQLELAQTRRYAASAAKELKVLECAHPAYDAVAMLQQPIRARVMQPYQGVELQLLPAATAAGKQRIHIDSEELVRAELKLVTENISRLLENSHCMLSAVSQYYLTSGRTRRLSPLVFLIAQASSAAAKCYSSGAENGADVDPYVPCAKGRLAVMPAHQQLAEIADMLHLTILLHDNVTGNTKSRREIPAVQQKFRDMEAIYAGDLLLAHGTMNLGRLRHPRVLELIMSAVADFVSCEYEQPRNLVCKDGSIAWPSECAFNRYLENLYLKAGSLAAKSCRSSAILSSTNEDIAHAAYVYGRNLGIARQIADDLLDLTASLKTFGKPACASLDLGQATAPVLYALQECPELGPLIARNFSNEGDASKAWGIIQASNGLERTKQLASAFAEQASHALELFPPSPARDALEHQASALLASVE